MGCEPVYSPPSNSLARPVPVMGSKEQCPKKCKNNISKKSETVSSAHC